MDRFLGWVFMPGVVLFPGSLLTTLAMTLDPWVIAWLAVLAGSAVGMTAGMTAGMVMFMEAMGVVTPEGS